MAALLVASAAGYGEEGQREGQRVGGGLEEMRAVARTAVDEVAVAVAAVQAGLMAARQEALEAVFVAAPTVV